MAVEVQSPSDGLIESRARELLADAYELVLSGWCQGAAARDEHGQPIEPSSVGARQWTVAGALDRLWRRSPLPPDQALEAFVRGNLALTAAIGDAPESWNDAPGRTIREVLDALAEALQLVRPVSADRSRG